MPSIQQINISPGGVPKLPIQEAIVTELGITGDGHRHAYHGGPDKALCLWSLDVIEALQNEGHPIFPGAAGENVTVEGLEWASLGLGTRLRLGEVEAEITGYAVPCGNQRSWFSDGRIDRLSHEVRPGAARLYSKVLKTGSMRPGDPVEVLPD